MKKLLPVVMFVVAATASTQHVQAAQTCLVVQDFPDFKVLSCPGSGLPWWRLIQYKGVSGDTGTDAKLFTK